MCEKQAYLTPSNNIGIRFSTIPFNSGSPAPIDNFAHLYSSIIINDSINWVHVSGSIIADSSYEYLMLGNFFDNVNTDTIQYIPNISVLSYYILDDICISTDSILCNTFSNVHENEIFNSFQIHPNPTFDFIHISNPKLESMDLVVLNTLGQVIKNFKSTNQNVIDIDFSTIDSGFYTIQIFCNEKFYYKKIIKN